MLDNFNSSVQYLLQNSFKIHDEQYGPMSTERMWRTWVGKFSSVYHQKEYSKFIPMFLNFFTKNQDFFTNPVFIEVNSTINMNVDWLRNEELLDGPGSLKVVNKKSWSKDGKQCKGLVIFFNDVEKFHMISIPISEIYLEACRLDKSKNELFPAKILAALYSAIYYVIPEGVFPEEKLAVEKNMNFLKDFIKNLAPDEGNSDIGDGLSGVSKILNTICKSAGLGDKTIDTKGIGETIGQYTKPETLDKVGKVVGTIFKGLKPSDGEDININSAIDNIGKTLQSTEIKDGVNGIMSSIPSSSSVSKESKETEPSDEEDLFDPLDQE